MNHQGFSFGAALRSVRLELGLSQLRLAEQLETTQRHISFLETGRAQPSRAMVGRIATGLALSGQQRDALLAASGFRHAGRPGLSGAPLETMLDMLDRQVLARWPYPGFILNPDWDVLRCNEPGAMMLGAIAGKSAGHDNLLVAFLSPEFQAMLQNWREISAALYFRMQAAVARSDKVRASLQDARARGLFANISDDLTRADDAKPYQPLVIKLPDGSIVQMSSLLSRIGSAHDALIDDLEVELTFPVDDASAARFFPG